MKTIDAETKSVFKNRFTKISVVFLTIAYAWMIAFKLEPHPEVSPKVSVGVFWLEKGQVKEWRHVSSSRMRAVARVSYELSALAGQIDTLGGFTEPPALLINADKDSVYKVDAKRIEISENIAFSEGQIVRTFIKSWLLQKGSKEINDSMLRTNVVSDVLSAMILDTDQFEVPGHDKSLVFPDPENWLRFARSHKAFCHSPWMVLEAHGDCGESELITSIGFRSLLDGMIWKTYLNTYPIERYGFLKSWAQSLQTTIKIADRRDPQTLLEWKDWVGDEFEQILPGQIFAADTNQRWGWDTARENARVRSTSTLSLEFAFYRAGGMKAPDRSMNWKSKPLLVSSSDSTVLYPGLVRLERSDLKGLRANWLVWQSCEPTKLGDVVDNSVQSERILYVQSCEQDSSNLWSALMFSGIKGFARAKSDTAFVELNREQTDLAIAQGALLRSSFLSDIMDKKISRENSLLGLDTAEWRKDVKAYHVLGAIEAIEWFRGPVNLNQPLSENSSSHRL